MVVMMNKNILVWNSRGVGGKAFPGLLVKIKRRHNVGFMAILEPRPKKEKAEWLAR